MRKRPLILLFSLFLLVLPYCIFSAALSTLETNKIFQSLKHEAVNTYLTLSLPSQDYAPEEEAVVVLSKAATFDKLYTLNLKELPKEFAVNALSKTGKFLASSLSDPSGVVKAEILSMGRDQLLERLKKEEVRLAGGKINLDYESMERKRESVELLYSVSKNKEGLTSVSFYSTEYTSPPLSVTRRSPVNSTEWRMDKFENEKLKPFVVTFSGNLRESSQGALLWEKEPKVSIEFRDGFKDLRIKERPSLLERAGNTGRAFVGGVSDLWSNLWGSEKKEETEVVRPAPLEKKEEGSGDDRDNGYDDEGDLDNDHDDGLDHDPSVDSGQDDDDGDDHDDEGDKEEKAAKVEVNSAIGEELELIGGIGPAYAERIMEKRPFCSLDELTEVPGIGKVTLESIKKEGVAYTLPPENCKEDSPEEDSPVSEEKEEAEEVLEEIKDRMEKLKEKVDGYYDESEDDYDSDNDDDGGDDHDDEEDDSDDDPSAGSGQDDNEEKEEEVTEVEINSAKKEKLTEIVHIGEKRAESIVEKRPFCNIEELTKISGIGDKTLSDIKEEGIAFVDPPEDCADDHDDEEDEDEDESDDDSDDDDDDSDDDNGDDDDSDDGDDDSDDDGDKGDVDFKIKVEGAEVVRNKPLSPENIDASGRLMERFSEAIVIGTDTTLHKSTSRINIDATGAEKEKLQKALIAGAQYLSQKELKEY